MPCIRPGLSTSLALGLVVGLSPGVRAGNLLGNCHTGCCDTTVKLPAQRVVVETAAPRVSVQQTQVSRGVAPAIGTVYMPVSLPVTGRGTAPTQGEAPPPEDNPLRAVHAAELAQLRQAMARAMAKAEIEAAQRVLDRLNAADCPKPQVEPTKPPPDLKDRIKEVGDRIDKIADRIDAIEKLSLIHDNYLQKEIQKANPPKPSDTPKP
jgi:hypothetical protein